MAARPGGTIVERPDRKAREKLFDALDQRRGARAEGAEPQLARDDRRGR